MFKKKFTVVVIVIFLTLVVSTDNFSTLNVGVFTDSLIKSKHSYILAKNFSRTIIPSVDLKLRYYNVTEITFAKIYRILDEGTEKNINLSLIIGPSSSTSVKVINSIASSKGIPHLAPLASDALLSDVGLYPRLLKLSPSNVYQTEAVADLIHFYGYNRISVIAIENDYGLDVVSRLQDLVNKRHWMIHVLHMFKMFDASSTIDMTEAMSEIANYVPHVIIVATYTDHLRDIIKNAILLKMEVKYKWIWIFMDGVITDEDIKQYSIKDSSFFFNGILGIRPVVSNGSLRDNFNDWATKETNYERISFNEEKTIDSVIVAMHGFQRYCNERNCKDVINGSQLYQHLTAVNAGGIASDLRFDSNGSIKCKQYNILFAKDGEWLNSGEWNDVDKLQIEHDLVLKELSFEDKGGDEEKSESDLILNIVTIIESPFMEYGALSEEITLKRKYKNRLFSDDIPKHMYMPEMDVLFKGYCLDLFEEISRLGEFKYTLRHVADNKFGSIDPETNTWNGMIGDVVRKDADLAVASITVTEERAKVVDFATEFMDIGLKFIISKSLLGHSQKDYDPFAFLLPFNKDLWNAIIGSVICLAFFVSFLASVSPYGVRGHFFLSNKSDELKLFEKSNQVNQEKAISKPDEFPKSDKEPKIPPTIKRLEEDRTDASQGMGLSNALYFTWASLFWQTPERVPRSISARFITAVWYVAAIVFLASYTANMVTFVSMRNTKMKSKLNSVGNLAMQSKIPYGTIADSSVEDILKNSHITVAKGLYDYISSDKNKFLKKDTATALEQVKSGSYILLWDSLALDYAAWEAKCELYTVDVGFGAVSYAFALKHNSPYKSAISRHLLKLRESGFLQKLWVKYFGFMDECGKESKTSEQESLTFHNLAGIFYMLVIAMCLGIIVMTVEWITMCFFDVNVNDYHAPHTLYDALCRRVRRLYQNIVDDFFSLSKIKEKWKTIELSLEDDNSLKRKKSVKENSTNKLKTLRGYSSMPDLKYYTDSKTAETNQRRMKRSLSLYETLSDRSPFHSKKRRMSEFKMQNLSN